jgi:Bacteriophage HK97-gp10, putative tail-component
MADGASIQLNGVEELKKLLEQYPAKVALTAQKRGLARGASRLRTYFRAEMPKVTGTLRKSIGYKTVKGSKGSKVIVGLNTRAYYKVLEQGRKAYKRKGKPVAGSPPMRDLGFSRVWYSKREGIAQLIIDEAKRAVYEEANKIHAKMLGIKRRKI